MLLGTDASRSRFPVTSFVICYFFIPTYELRGSIAKLSVPWPSYQLVEQRVHDLGGYMYRIQNLGNESYNTSHALPLVYGSMW